MYTIKADVRFTRRGTRHCVLDRHGHLVSAHLNLLQAVTWLRANGEAEAILEIGDERLTLNLTPSLVADCERAEAINA